MSIATFVAVAVVAVWCTAMAMHFDEPQQPTYRPLTLLGLLALVAALSWLLAPRLHGVAFPAALGIGIAFGAAIFSKPPKF